MALRRCFLVGKRCSLEWYVWLLPPPAFHLCHSSFLFLFLFLPRLVYTLLLTRLPSFPASLPPFLPPIQRYSRFMELRKVIVSLRQADQPSLSSSSSPSSSSSTYIASSIVALWGKAKTCVQEAVKRWEEDVIEGRKEKMHAFLSSLVYDPLLWKEEGVRRAMGLEVGEGAEVVGA